MYSPPVEIIHPTTTQSIPPPPNPHPQIGLSQYIVYGVIHEVLRSTIITFWWGLVSWDVLVENHSQLSMISSHVCVSSGKRLKSMKQEAVSVTLK